MRILSVRWLVVVFAVATVTLRGPFATASCVVPRDLGRALRGIDAAFIGTSLGVDPAPGLRRFDQRFNTVWHFRVERSVKGELPRYIDVLSVGENAEDNLSVLPGDRAGIILQRHEAWWVAGGCSHVSQNTLLDAARYVTPGSIFEVPRPHRSLITPTEIVGLGLVTIVGLALFIRKRGTSRREAG